MAVIIVHGTHDPEGTWWIESPQGGFAEEVDAGIRKAVESPQVWRIRDVHVSQFNELRPKGQWHSLRGQKDPPF